MDTAKVVFYLNKWGLPLVLPITVLFTPFFDTFDHVSKNDTYRRNTLKDKILSCAWNEIGGKGSVMGKVLQFFTGPLGKLTWGIIKGTMKLEFDDEGKMTGAVPI